MISEKIITRQQNLIFAEDEQVRIEGAEPYYFTDYGAAYLGDSLELLKKTAR